MEILNVHKEDKWIIDTVNSFIQEEYNWLKDSLIKVKNISDKRSSNVSYGFEWLIQTAFSYTLLNRKDISKLMICQKSSNGKKYDIDLITSQKRIIIEIKTIAPGGISFIKPDIIKEFPKDCIPYFLVFSYPTDLDIIPKFEGVVGIYLGIAPEKFRYYIYKKS